MESQTPKGDDLKKTLSIKRIRRQAERISAMEDRSRATKLQRRLAAETLHAIANGQVKDPLVAARIVFPE